jgi:hypothetical protein
MTKRKFLCLVAFSRLGLFILVHLPNIFFTVVGKFQNGRGKDATGFHLIRVELV